MIGDIFNWIFEKVVMASFIIILVAMLALYGKGALSGNTSTTKS